MHMSKKLQIIVFIQAHTHLLAVIYCKINRERLKIKIAPFLA